MEPTLKHPMCILAEISSPTSPLAEIRAGNTAVMVFPRISPPCILSWMHEGALGPVMGVSSRAGANLEGEHPEFIGGVDAVLDVREGGINWVLFLLPLCDCWQENLNSSRRVRIGAVRRAGRDGEFL